MAMDEKTPQKSPFLFGLPRNVIGMGAVSFLNDLSSDMIYPFIPAFLIGVLGATPAFVGLVEGVADATASILRLVSGALSDALRRRKPIVVWGYAISAVSKPLLAFAVLPWHALGVRFLDRVGKGAREAPRDALISSSVTRERAGRAFGFHRGADTLGAALGPLVAFLVLPLIGHNIRTLFLLSFVASVAAIIILVLVVREIKPPAVVPAAVRPHIRIRVAAHPSFFIFLTAATIFSLGRASDVFILLRAQSLGFALMVLPLLYAAYNIAGALLATPAGVLSDRLGHRATYMVGMGVFAVSYVLFGLARTAWVLWPLVLFYGCSAALTDGVGRAIVARLVDEEERGSAYGIYGACTGIAALPASFFFGFLWQNYGPAVPFYTGASLAVLAYLIFLILRFEKRRRMRGTFLSAPAEA